jgi:hypothetical protein
MRLLVIYLLVITAVQGPAAPFQNLGFDDANTNNVQYLPLRPFFPVQGIGAAEALVPHWQLFDRANPLTSVGYNLYNETGTSNLITILDQSAISGPLEGKYLLGISRPSTVFSVEQTGDVPSDAQFLTFRSHGTTGVLINNQLLMPAIDPFTERASLNISVYSGQNVRLGLVALDNVDFVFIDSLVFTVPEPGVWALFGLGTLAFLATGACSSERK